MMTAAVRSEDLRAMTDTELARTLEGAFESGRDVNGAYLAALDAKIRVFEQRYEMPTSSLLDALAAERIPETAEICEWLFLHDLRVRLGQARP